MNKILELAREVWGFENWTHVQLEMIERFYTLCRADLEADLVKHRELLVHHLSVIDPLRAENASLGKRHAALLESHAHLEAENAKLRDVFDELLTNIDHATSCGAWNVQVGSQTHETIEAARAALGEK